MILSLPKLHVIIFLCMLSGICFAFPVFAQTAIPVPQQSRYFQAAMTQGIEILPVKQDARVERGKVEKLRFSVKNSENTSIAIRVFLKDITSISAQGVPVFEEEKPSSYLTWTQKILVKYQNGVEESYTYSQLEEKGIVLDPVQVVHVEFEMKVPVEEKSKSHYFGVFFEKLTGPKAEELLRTSPTTPKSLPQQNVQIKYQLGALVAINVSDIPLDGQLEVLPGKWEGTNLPVTLSNQSNSYLRVSGEAWLSDIWKNWQSEEVPVNSSGQWLLQDEQLNIRLSDTRQNWWNIINLYSLHTRLHLNGEQVERVIPVLFVDWSKVLVVVLVLLMSFFISLMLLRRRKSLI